MVNIDQAMLQAALKQAVIEALEERREFLRDIVAEALEDLAMAEAIREGLESPLISEGEVKRIFKESA
jgi:hypothetical protein